MDDRPFLWYYALGSDETNLRGGFATREDATAIALAESSEDFDHVTLVEARDRHVRQIFSLTVPTAQEKTSS